MAFSCRLAGRLSSVVFGMLMVAGCSNFLQPTTAPIPTAQHVEPAARNETLLVFLPGIGDEPADFSREGFIEAVRGRGIPADMITVDAHFGYYMSKTLVDRLHADVIAPAREDGYKHIWLVGVSLGGLGSFLYSREHPNEIDGIIALAPYLGEDVLIEEIRRAGGPAEWEPHGSMREDFRSLLWRYLAGYERGPQHMPRLVLAYGSHDRYADGHDLLADLLPPEQVIKRPGAHHWDTWQVLWQTVLDTAQLETVREIDVASAGRAAQR